MVAGRKAVGLLDNRTGAVEETLLHQMETKEYVRCIDTTHSSANQLLVSSDCTVRLWDLRCLRAERQTAPPAVASLPTAFRRESCTQVTSVADPGSGAFFTLDTDPGYVFFRIPDLGSRIPTPYFLELSDKFLGKKFYNSLKTGPNFFL